MRSLSKLVGLQTVWCSWLADCKQNFSGFPNLTYNQKIKEQVAGQVQNYLQVKQIKLGQGTNL